MTTSRTCGECSLCCKLLPIDLLDKQANLWCQHCKPGNGCSIYNARPQVCRDYHCGWLLGALNDSWYPTNCHMIVTLPYEGQPACMVAVDPDHSNIWEQEPYLDDLRRMAAQYGFVQVVLASFCRERQDSAVESRFLAFFAASFACYFDVWCNTY